MENEDIDCSVIDTLKRQMIEVQKQIDKAQNINKSKALELQRANDQRKARLVLNCLKLKKQNHDLKAFLEENRKQWALDISQRQTSILVTFMQQYSTYLKQEKYLKIKYLNEIEQALLIPTLIQLNLQENSKYRRIFSSINEEETTGNNLPSFSLDINSSNEQITQEQLRVNTDKSDERYLSTNLRAVIEGNASTERVSSIQTNIESIRKELRKFINKLKKSELEDGVSYLLQDSVIDSIDALKPKLFQISPGYENLSSIQNSKSFGHTSVFSFSNPDFTIPIAEDITPNISPIRFGLTND